MIITKWHVLFKLNINLNILIFTKSVLILTLLVNLGSRDTSPVRGRVSSPGPVEQEEEDDDFLDSMDVSHYSQVSSGL